MARSKRLLAVCSLIKKQVTVFDVGSGHGLIAIYLSKTNRVISSDVSKIIVEDLKRKLPKSEVILSDGLEKLDVKYEDVVVLAGMGTRTIIKILQNDLNKLSYNIITLTHNDHYELRRKMRKLGYSMADEKIVLENKRYYIVNLFVKKINKQSISDYLFGIHGKNNKEYLKHLLQIKQKQYKVIPFNFDKVKMKILIILIEKKLSKL